MKHKYSKSLMILFLLAATNTGVCQDNPKEKSAAEILLSQLSGTDATGKQEVLKSALSEDGQQIRAVIVYIKDRSQVAGDREEKKLILQRDASARSAIFGLVMLAAAPGNKTQSTQLAKILVSVTGNTHGEGVDRFLTRMLGDLGNPIGVVPMLEAVISDQNWSDESIRSLGSIPGLAAQQALLEILQKGPGRWKPAAATSLAMRGEAEGVIPALLALLTEEDTAITESALDALVALGSPQAMKPAVDRLVAAPDSNKSKHADQVLELAERLEAGRYESYSINLLDALLLSKGVPENRRRSASKLRQRCASWTSIFDGKSSEGWIGQTDGYQFADGEIRCEPGNGGNIYTADEYSDFIFRFEFKLSPGSNNGVGIRAPAEGNAAFEGMEVQIIDNSAEKYATLKPYQMHGSIYGVAPAQVGHLLPVGQWNFQEIRCDGRRVTVSLNGTTILDTDLDVVSRGGTVDGVDHPGLKRKSGHIGFLGHGDAVAFRNLRVRSLSE
ncbi:MAG: DUF1080 domain-containing protein [Planctomycetota bacterium]|nr:DUF1080 domain-containing protein [Planctomycetota bacterium]